MRPDRLQTTTGQTAWFFIAALAAPALAQTPSGGKAADADAGLDAGFWPTPRMVELFLERGGEDLARKLSLDEKQKTVLLADMKQRWPDFLRKHRRTVQPMMNEMIEMSMANETPTAEKAAAWARAALPILEDTKKNMDEGTAALAKVLNAEQKKQLQKEITLFNMGYTFMTTRARAWKEGRFSPSDWPTEGGPGRRGRGGRWRDRERGAAASAESRPAPKDEWTRYVERFIEDYSLDAGQQASAQAILKDMKDQAADLLRDHERLTERASATGPSAGGRDTADSRLTQVRKSLDERFTVLKQRLHALLTSSQRARGERAER